MPFEFDFNSINVMDLKTVIPAVLNDRVNPAAEILAKHVRGWDFEGKDPHQAQSYFDLTYLEEWPKLKEDFMKAWQQWRDSITPQPFKGDLKKITIQDYQAVQSISFYDGSEDYIQKIARVMRLTLPDVMGQDDLWLMRYKRFAEAHRGMIEALTKRAERLGE